METRSKDEVAGDLILNTYALALAMTTAQFRLDHNTKSAQKKRSDFVAGVVDGLKDTTVPHPHGDVPPIHRCYTPSFGDGFEFGRRVRLIVEYASKEGYVSASTVAGLREEARAFGVHVEAKEATP